MKSQKRKLDRPKTGRDKRAANSNLTPEKLLRKSTFNKLYTLPREEVGTN